MLAILSSECDYCGSKNGKRCMQNGVWSTLYPKPATNAHINRIRKGHDLMTKTYGLAWRRWDWAPIGYSDTWGYRQNTTMDGKAINGDFDPSC